jgi:hypothetical protein
MSKQIAKVIVMSQTLNSIFPILDPIRNPIEIPLYRLQNICCIVFASISNIIVCV